MSHRPAAPPRGVDWERSHLQVRFLPGFFADTLPRAPIESLAFLRLDGDYYRSTWDALAALYPLLSPGECTARTQDALTLACHACLCLCMCMC